MKEADEMRYASSLFTFTVVLVFVMIGCVAASPQVIWLKYYLRSGDDAGRSVIEMPNRNFAIAGDTDSSGAGDYDLCLLITDPDGDTLSTRTYGGPLCERGYSVDCTGGGGIVLAGYTESFGAGGNDFYVVMTDSAGDTLWTRTYGGLLNDRAYSISRVSTGGFIVAGRTASFGPGGISAYLVRADANGDTIWTRSYGGAGTDYGLAVRETSDGGFVLAGHTDSYGLGDSDVYLVKTDADGDTTWVRTFGGVGEDFGRAVEQTDDGGYLVVGDTHSYGTGDQSIYVVRTDASGDSLWTRAYGPGYGKSVVATYDGGFAVVAERSIPEGGLQRTYMIKMDALGDTLWAMEFDFAPGVGNSIAQTADSGYVVVGDISLPSGGEVALLRLGAECASIPPRRSSTELSVLGGYPNPFHRSIYFRVETDGLWETEAVVYDVKGRTVTGVEVDAAAGGMQSLTWDGKDLLGQDLPPGVYFFRVQAGNQVVTRKMILLR
jgi:hypothetical protein